MKWILLVLVIVMFAGCSSGDPIAQQAPTDTPSQEAPVETPVPTATLQPYTSLGSDWEGEIMETAAEGEVRVYHHYITNYAQYDDLIINDELVMVENVCYGEPQNIKDMFGLVSEPGEKPERYQSWSIEFKSNCYIAFTVKNVEGDTMGVKFISHCPLCNY